MFDDGNFNHGSDDDDGDDDDDDDDDDDESDKLDGVCDDGP